MKKIVLFFTLLFLITPVYAEDEVFQVTQGFLTGEKFLKLSEDNRVSYSMGIVDGYLSAPIFGANNNNKYLEWISTCIKGKSNTQIAAILVKYLKDNPGQWDKPAQLLMYNALREACVK